MRRRNVYQTFINLNMYSTQECLRTFSLVPEDMRFILSFFDFLSRTVRRRYTCSELTVACIILRRISFPCRWYDIERMFGMCAAKLCEIFWELSQRVFDNHKTLITPFHSSLIAENAELHSQNICTVGAMVPKFIGLLM